ncbi:MAG TPA: glycosyltransferase [Candidatus Baltobacteraceae bacterium]|nr:glycosyltransferase [Candidatus Baltobacteraceae bacterium]
MAAVSQHLPRVLYVAQDDLSKNSGYAYRVDRLRRAMENAGAAVTVLGYCSGAPAIECTCTKSRLFRRLWPLWKGLATPASGAVISSIGAPYNGIYALLLRLSGKTVIYDAHDLVQYVLPATFGKHWAIATPWIALSERLVGVAAAVTITASPTAREFYAKRYGGFVRLMYNIRGNNAPAPLVRRDIRKEFGWQSATIIVYAGGLQRGVRGIERQFEAVAAARARGMNVVLLLLGYGERGYFESLGAALLREGSLRFIDHVAPEMMGGILRQCDVAVSAEPIGYLLPSKYFDYVASGVRVVAIDDNRDVIRALGEFVARYDGSTEGLVQYLTQGVERMDVASVERGRALIRSLDGMADKIATEIVENLDG